MSGSATENSILVSLLERLNKIFNQSIRQTQINCKWKNIMYMVYHSRKKLTEMKPSKIQIATKKTSNCRGN